MTGPAHVPAAPSRPRFRLRLDSFGPLLGLIAACVLFGALRYETFVTWENFSIILLLTAVIGVAALGMTLVIIVGGIDLSVGSIIALGTVVVAMLIDLGWSPLTAAAG